MGVVAGDGHHLRGVDDVKRPDWAAAGTLALAWREAEARARTSPIEWYRGLCATAMQVMSDARVVTITAEQVEALPTTFDTYAGSAEAFLDVALPFDTLYLSCDGAPMGRYGDPDGAERPRLLGAILYRPTLPDWALPQWDRQQPIIIPLVEIPEKGPLFVGFVFAARQPNDYGRAAWVGGQAAGPQGEGDCVMLRRGGATYG